jgi:hypothetical protein
VNSLAFVLLKDTVSTEMLFTGALNGNVIDSDLFIHELFKGVLLPVQVIQLRIKGEGYVYYLMTLFSFTAANKVITYRESVIRMLLFKTNQLEAVPGVEWGDFEFSLDEGVEESVRRLFSIIRPVGRQDVVRKRTHTSGRISITRLILDTGAFWLRFRRTADSSTLRTEE